jgi:hypothetical protein
MQYSFWRYSFHGCLKVVVSVLFFGLVVPGALGIILTAVFIIICQLTVKSNIKGLVAVATLFINFVFFNTCIPNHIHKK